MDEPRGYCAEWSKSVRERQMSYVESREQDKQTNNRNKLIDTESILMVVRLGGGMGEKDRGLRGTNW